MISKLTLMILNNDIERLQVLDYLFKISDYYTYTPHNFLGYHYSHQSLTKDKLLQIFKSTDFKFYKNDQCIFTHYHIGDISRYDYQTFIPFIKTYPKYLKYYSF